VKALVIIECDVDMSHVDRDMGQIKDALPNLDLNAKVPHFEGQVRLVAGAQAHMVLQYLGARS
jgi:hypothetical protein